MKKVKSKKPKKVVATYVLFGFCIFFSLMGILTIATSEDITASPGYQQRQASKTNGTNNSSDDTLGLSYNYYSSTDSYTITGKGSFTGTSLSTPSTHAGKPITRIGNYSFEDCDLTTINLTGSLYLTVIGYSAFIRSKTLTTVYIGTSVKKIDEFAFASCTALRAINYSGTKAQWSAITKGQYWNNNTGSYYVYCSDGTIY